MAVQFWLPMQRISYLSSRHYIMLFFFDRRRSKRSVVELYKYTIGLLNFFFLFSEYLGPTRSRISVIRKLFPRIISIRKLTLYLRHFHDVLS